MQEEDHIFSPQSTLQGLDNAAMRRKEGCDTISTPAPKTPTLPTGKLPVILFVPHPNPEESASTRNLDSRKECPPNSLSDMLEG